MITAQTHLKESEPFIPYKALLIVLSSVSHAAAMSCAATMNVAMANSRYGSRCL